MSARDVINMFCPAFLASALRTQQIYDGINSHIFMRTAFLGQQLRICDSPITYTRHDTTLLSITPPARFDSLSDRFQVSWSDYSKA